MDNQNLLFLNNQQFQRKGRINSSKGKCLYYYIEIRDEILSGFCIHKIIQYINFYIPKYSKSRLPILIDFVNNLRIADKLTYVFFECICFYLVNDLGIEVHIKWKPKMNIITEGLNSSPLLLLQGKSRKNVSKFIEKFQNDGYGNHFRRLVKNSNTNLCSIFQDVDSFFKLFNSCDSVKDEIVEMIAELVANAFEHGGSDCLIDIDVADHYNTKIDGTECRVYSVNLIIINFSQKLIGDEIKQRIFDDNMRGDRNEFLLEAFEYHKNYLFDESYTENDFYNIAVFQDKISGTDKGSSGGKGLTLLIKSLQQSSYEDHCYMLSGNKIISFQKEYLIYDDDNWIGFNKEKDFFHTKPSHDVIRTYDTFMPGTAYNLDFIILKKGECKNEQYI